VRFKQLSQICAGCPPKFLAVHVVIVAANLDIACPGTELVQKSIKLLTLPKGGVGKKGRFRFGIAIVIVSFPAKRRFGLATSVIEEPLLPGTGFFYPPNQAMGGARRREPLLPACRPPCEAKGMIGDLANAKRPVAGRGE
jgi:hypothetical protein